MNAQDVQLLAENEVQELLGGLRRLYPDADCELRHTNALELLIATILSAQSTDERVNQVTEHLFVKYKTAADYANADPEVFEQEIRSTGFYRNKAKMVLGAARRMVEVYGGEVPETLEEMVTLPGVARKTANLVLGTAFGKPTGVVVDTHVKRLALRLGLSTQKSPDKIERDLMDAVSQDDWIFFSHSVILHGRRVCKAKKPACEGCGLADVCPRNGVE